MCHALSKACTQFALGGCAKSLGVERFSVSYEIGIGEVACDEATLTVISLEASHVAEVRIREDDGRERDFVKNGGSIQFCHDQDLDHG